MDLFQLDLALLILAAFACGFIGGIMFWYSIKDTPQTGDLKEKTSKDEQGN